MGPRVTVRTKPPFKTLNIGVLSATQHIPFIVHFSCDGDGRKADN